MRHFLSPFHLLAAILLFATACSSESESIFVSDSRNSDALSKFKAYNSSLATMDITRGNGTVQAVDDGTLEIVEADVIGALEGAYKGFNYSINNGLSEYETYAVILTSAITHAIARSHAASVKFQDTTAGYYFAAPPHKNYSNNTESFRRDIVSLSFDEKIKNNPWMSVVDPRLEEKYPRASKVGKKHNAVLSVIDTIQKVKSFERVLDNYDSCVTGYLTSSFFVNNFANVIVDPLKSNSLSKSFSDDKGTMIWNVFDLFLEAVKIQGRNSDDYKKLMTDYFAMIENNSSFNQYEKESVYMSFMVGMYSLNYWSETYRSME